MPGRAFFRPVTRFFVALETVGPVLGVVSDRIGFQRPGTPRRDHDVFHGDIETEQRSRELSQSLAVVGRVKARQLNIRSLSRRCSQAKRIQLPFELPRIGRASCRERV